MVIPPVDPSAGLPEGEPLSIVVRPMVLSDIEEVHTIDTLSFSLPWPAGSYRFELRDNPNSVCLVAEARFADRQRRVIGMVIIWLILDEAHIATIAVHPAFRGRGAGRMLLAAALQEAVLKNAIAATLEVRAHNIGAQTLYRDFGFEVVGSRPRYYQDNNEDALIMTLSGLGPETLDRLADEHKF